MGCPVVDGVDVVVVPLVRVVVVEVEVPVGVVEVKVLVVVVPVGTVVGLVVVVGAAVGPPVVVSDVGLVVVLLMTSARMMAERTKDTMDITDTTTSATTIITLEDGMAVEVDTQPHVSSPWMPSELSFWVTVITATLSVCCYADMKTRHAF